VTGLAATRRLSKFCCMKKLCRTEQTVQDRTKAEHVCMCRGDAYSAEEF